MQIRTKKFSLNPSPILIGFEQDAINAINNVFPQASVEGCHFHYAQSVWRQIKKYSLVKCNVNSQFEKPTELCWVGQKAFAFFSLIP